MSYTIEKGGTINKRYRVILLNNRYFIMDYVSPYKLINYIGLFILLVRSSYLAWEIEERDLARLKFKGSNSYIKPIKLFEGEHDVAYEADLIDKPQSKEGSTGERNFGFALGFALIPAIAAIPGLNLPMWVRGLFLSVSLGFLVWYILSLLRIPRLETEHYKPVIIGRYERYGKKTTGFRLFGMALGFLACVAIQIGSIYAWVTIPFRDFNIIFYLVATLFVWGLTFGYFIADPRDTELSDSDPDKEEMKKYIIVDDMHIIRKKNDRLSFLTYVLVWILVAIVVYFILINLIFLIDYIYGILAFVVSAGVSLIAVIVASVHHDGYKRKDLETSKD